MSKTISYKGHQYRQVQAVLPGAGGLPWGSKGNGNLAVTPFGNYEVEGHGGEYFGFFRPKKGLSKRFGPKKNKQTIFDQMEIHYARMAGALS